MQRSEGQSNRRRQYSQRPRIPVSQQVHKKLNRRQRCSEAHKNRALKQKPRRYSQAQKKRRRELRGLPAAPVPTMTCVIKETRENAHRNSTLKRAVDQERARSSRVVAPRIPPKEAPSALLRDGSCCFKMIHGRAGYSSQVGLMSGQRVDCPHASARCSPQAKQASLRARWSCSSRHVIRGCQRNAADGLRPRHATVPHRVAVSPNRHRMKGSDFPLPHSLASFSCVLYPFRRRN